MPHHQHIIYMLFMNGVIFKINLRLRLGLRLCQLVKHIAY